MAIKCMYHVGMIRFRMHCEQIRCSSNMGMCDFISTLQSARYIAPTFRPTIVRLCASAWQHALHSARLTCVACQHICMCIRCMSFRFDFVEFPVCPHRHTSTRRNCFARLGWIFSLLLSTSTGCARVFAGACAYRIPRSPV